MLHEPSLQDIEMASPYYLEARGCSSSDHLAHPKRISSYDSKSRSLDASCASSYTTNDPLISAANSDNPAANPLVASCASSYTSNVRLIRAANHDNLTANSSNEEMISPTLDLECPKDVKMVPFKWEEAPGRPMDTSSSNGLVIYNPSSLQLPPKLQCQSHQSPPRLMPACQESPLLKKLRQPITHSLSQSPPNKRILKRLCTYVLKTASCSGHGGPPLHKFSSHSWSNPPCIEFSSTPSHHYKQHDKLAFNDRLFFDRHSPKDLRHCASMDSILPIFNEPYQREDEFVSRKALSLLAMEEDQEAESTTTATTTSSPWQPMSFHEREGSASPWEPAPTIKVCRTLAEEEDDDDDDDEGFHDLFSTASSSMKPSQRTDDDGMESACSSPSPWYLDFSPEEEEVQVETRGSKLIVTLVALIKLKGVISRKVISKFKRRGEETNHQLAESTIWSPTLATYLYNQQLEEENQIKTPISSPTGTSSDDGHSELGSNRLKIDPNYYLPATIRTHLMNPNHYHSDDDENLTPSAAHQERQDKESPYFTEEEEEERDNLRNSTHSLSLREQLIESDDEYLAPSFYKERNRDSRTLDGHPDNHFKVRQPSSACKGMCKVRKTVKLVASTIKLILVQTEIGHKKGAQRSFHSCIKPTVNI